MIDLLHCKQTQNNMTHTLKAMHQLQNDHANGSLIDNIPTFNGRPELYIDQIQNLENIAEVTKQNSKELALGKAQGAVIKHS